MMREPLDLLAKAVGIKRFDGIHDKRVDFTAAFTEHLTVSDVVRKGVLECILQVRKELARIQESGRLQIVEQTAKLVLFESANCLQEGEWDVVSDYGRLLQQVLVGGGQRVDTRSEDCPHRGRDLGARERPRNAVTAACALKHTIIDQRSHDLLDEKRVPASALHQEMI